MGDLKVLNTVSNLILLFYFAIVKFFLFLFSQIFSPGLFKVRWSLSTHPCVDNLTEQTERTGTTLVSLLSVSHCFFPFIHPPHDSIDTMIHLLHQFITSKNCMLLPSILLFNLNLIPLISLSKAPSLCYILSPFCYVEGVC